MSDQIHDFETADDDFTKDISPKDVVHSEVVQKTDFFPWHKPRKHWLRLHQWNTSIARLIETLKLGENTRSLNYLSLPGPDLLDVRAIQPVCAGVNVKLRFLGLNHIGTNQKAMQREQALSISEVRAMPLIDPASDVYLDKFEHIANTSSIAYGRVIKDKSSFDVVNIDLCSSFAATRPGENIPNQYDALFKLLRHQADTRTDDWLFFMTTRNNTDMVHEEAFNRFLDSIDTMLKTDQSFQQTLVQKNVFPATAFAEGQIDRTALNSASFANSFLVGIGKWIVSALLDNNPRWKVQTLPIFAYHVASQNPECDMVSLGFYCSKVLEEAIDKQGLAGATVNANVQSAEAIDTQCMRRLIDKISEQTDVDVKLHLEEDAYVHSLDSSAALMKTARYSEPHYRTWAEGEKTKLVKLLHSWGLVNQAAA